jgi:ribosomal protein S18 acetylase RimI-like enzyme
METYLSREGLYTMYEIREMTIDDYDSSITLWRVTEGMWLSEADSRDSIAYYLNRNPEMSFVCVDDEKIIGTVLCGHDGRRGYMYHVAVDLEYRGKSIAKKLVSCSLDKLKLAGITKCHLMVIDNNEIGNRFWTQSGWQRRSGIVLYSSNT